MGYPSPEGAASSAYFLLFLYFLLLIPSLEAKFWTGSCMIAEKRGRISLSLINSSIYFFNTLNSLFAPRSRADDRSGKGSLLLKPTIVKFFDMQTVVRIKSFALIAMLSNVSNNENANQRSSLRSLPTGGTLFRRYRGAHGNRLRAFEANTRCEKGPLRYG